MQKQKIFQARRTKLAAWRTGSPSSFRQIHGKENGPMTRMSLSEKALGTRAMRECTAEQDRLAAKAKREPVSLTEKYVPQNSYSKDEAMYFNNIWKEAILNGSRGKVTEMTFKLWQVYFQWSLYSDKCQERKEDYPVLGMAKHPKVTWGLEESAEARPLRWDMQEPYTTLRYKQWRR